MPYLQKAAPTQEQTGRIAPSASGPDTGADDDLTRSTSQTAETGASDPYGPRRWHSSLVKLAGKNRALNEFAVERVGEDPENTLVMLHGYGAGLGYYYKNFEPLSRLNGWRLFALDLLGMGRSARPTFRIHAKDPEGKIAEAEDWFVDALEEWRIARKIERFTLLGHSLGAYMSVAYALKYPGRLNKLILASPVGIPEDPYAVASEPPDSGDAPPGSAQKPQAPQRPYPRWFAYLWDANVSPFSLVRLSGPIGPRLVSGWTTRRFSMLPPDEAKALHDYAYTLFRQKGSGEYALAYVLAPGAYARSPLLRRIADVGRGTYDPAAVTSLSAPASSSASTASTKDVSSVTQVRERGVPVVLLYGDHDWMDAKAGRAAADLLRQRRKDETAELPDAEKRRDNGSAEVHVIKNAGHHVYLDGWEEFNAIMGREMRDVEKRERERRAYESAGRP